jgi:ABC-type polar amino acid transport system ATPase subunit
MIEVQQLKKAYPGQPPLLNDVSVCFPTAKVSVLLGGSGSGKSTLLHCLLQLETPDSGRILMNGTPLATARRGVEIAGVMQFPSLFRHLTVLQNLTLAPVNVLKHSEKEAAHQAGVLLETLELGDKAHCYPEQLSGGELQRVALGRAWMMQPKVLVLDEPTTALNAELIHQLVRLLRRMAERGTTVVLSTHDRSFAEAVGDCLFWLDNGKLTLLKQPVAHAC